MKKLILASFALAATTLMLSITPARAEDAPDVDCANAETQMDMNYCAEQDFDKADAALNKAYKKAVAAQKEVDAQVEQDVGPDSVGALASLKKAQRAWIDYRDGQCDGEGFSARGGSMEPMLVMACKTELSRVRTKQLLEFSQGSEN